MRSNTLTPRDRARARAARARAAPPAATIRRDERPHRPRRRARPRPRAHLAPRGGGSRLQFGHEPRWTAGVRRRQLRVHGDELHVLEQRAVRDDVRRPLPGDVLGLGRVQRGVRRGVQRDVLGLERVRAAGGRRVARGVLGLGGLRRDVLRRELHGGLLGHERVHAAVHGRRLHDRVHLGDPAGLRRRRADVRAGVSVTRARTDGGRRGGARAAQWMVELVTIGSPLASTKMPG